MARRTFSRTRDGTLVVTLYTQEVELLAMTARDMLANDGIAAAVVSMPCWELFEQQAADYQAAVLGSAPRLGVEAAVRFGWDRWLGPRGVFVGMHDFGASAPGEDVYKHFGITAEKVAAAARALL